MPTRVHVLTTDNVTLVTETMDLMEVLDELEEGLDGKAKITGAIGLNKSHFIEYDEIEMGIIYINATNVVWVREVNEGT